MANMDQAAALELSRKYGAFYQGHFIGTQGERKGLGLHMPEYFDSRTLITWPRVIGKLAVGIAQLLEVYDIEAVVGMPLGALTLGSDVAKELHVRYAMAEKSGDGLVIARSAFVEVVEGKKVAIVEDTMNDGTTLRQGIEAVRRCGGLLQAVGVLVNRGPTTSDSLGVPLHELINLPLESVTREACLENGQCSRSEPINRRPGHGHDLEQLIASGEVAADPHYRFV